MPLFEISELLTNRSNVEKKQESRSDVTQALNREWGMMGDGEWGMII